MRLVKSTRAMKIIFSFLLVIVRIFSLVFWTIVNKSIKSDGTYLSIWNIKLTKYRI